MNRHVITTRPARPGDAPFPAGQTDPSDPKRAPGPDGLWAMVRIDTAHHASIFIDDSASGTSHKLVNRWATGPKWSPDGRWIACNTWVSRERPWVLVVVDMAAGQSWEPPLLGTIGDYRWSPDSKWLAADAVGGPWGNGAILVIDPAARRFTPLDSAVVLADYEYAWGPDCRTLAVVKPTRMDKNYTDEETQSDLWLMDAGGAKRRILRGLDARLLDPQWLDADNILYSREVWGPESTTPPKRRVATLSRRP